MKIQIALLAIIATLVGCQSTPISTNFEVQRPDGLGLSYSSEKDVIYEKTLTLDDGTIESTKFQALASAAAFAQAERDRAQAEANAASAAAVVEALKLIPGAE